MRGAKANTPSNGKHRLSGRQSAIADCERAGAAPTSPALIDCGGPARFFSGEVQAYRGAPGTRFVALEARASEFHTVLECPMGRMADAAGKRPREAIACGT